MSSDNGRTITIVAYVLHLLGAMFGLPSIIALIINYVVKSDGHGEMIDSHHAWMIRSFWYAFLGCIISWVLVVIFIGWLGLALVWLWYVYRHIRGLIDLAENKSMSATA